MINTSTFAHEHDCVKYFEDGVTWLMDGKDDSAYKLTKQIGFISFLQ
jgi:hypothetical protein